MNKLIVSLVLFLGLISLRASVVNGAAGDMTKAWKITEVTLSSQVIFTGPGYVGAVWNSSGVFSSMSDGYSVVIDTRLLPNSVFASVSSSEKRTPPLIFVTTLSVVTGSNLPLSGIDYGDPGVFISTTCTLWKTADNSGEARKTFVKWKR